MLVHFSRFCRPPQPAVTRLPHGPFPVSHIHIRAGSNAGTPHTVPNTFYSPTSPHSPTVATRARTRQEDLYQLGQATPRGLAKIF